VAGRRDDNRGQRRRKATDGNRQAAFEGAVPALWPLAVARADRKPPCGWIRPVVARQMIEETAFSRQNQSEAFFTKAESESIFDVKPIRWGSLHLPEAVLS